MKAAAGLFHGRRASHPALQHFIHSLLYGMVADDRMISRLRDSIGQ